MRAFDMHADDYGLSKSNSKRIIELINADRLDSISILPNMSYFDDAVSLYQNSCDRIQETKISVHLNIVEGRCLSDKSDMDLFVDETGRFVASWMRLASINYSSRLRKRAKRQLKGEIKLQIERVASVYGLSFDSLRIDSHQHTHMIPYILESVTEVLNDNNWKAEYIRDMHELVGPYLTKPAFYLSYNPMNLVKVIILNHYSKRDAKLFRELGLSKMYAAGVFLSGRMDINRLGRIIPDLLAIASRKGAAFEILAHPGRAIPSEMTGDESFTQFHLSPNRDVEYEMIEQLVI